MKVKLLVCRCVGMIWVLVSSNALVISLNSRRVHIVGSGSRVGRRMICFSVLVNSWLVMVDGVMAFIVPAKFGVSMVCTIIWVRSSTEIQLMYCRPSLRMPPIFILKGGSICASAFLRAESIILVRRCVMWMLVSRVGVVVFF